MRVKRSYSDGGEEYNSAVVTVYTYTILALYRRCQFIFHLSFLPCQYTVGFSFKFDCALFL